MSEVAEQTVPGRVRDLVEPPLTADGFEIVDVEHTHSSGGGGRLCISVDRAGGSRYFDAVSEATRRISALLDEHDDIVPGRYTLEVSSPGVERPLRTADQFRRHIGGTVSVKTRPGTKGERRMEGTLEAADDQGVTVDGRNIVYADIERAHTVFRWERSPKRSTKKKAAPPDAGLGREQPPQEAASLQAPACLEESRV